VSLAVVKGVMLETLNEADRPTGAMAVTFTNPENPFKCVTLTVELTLDPAGTGRVAGEDAIEKSGPTTVTETKVGWKRKPLKPSTSTVYVPGTVELTLSVAVPEPVIDVGVTVAFTLRGA